MVTKQTFYQIILAVTVIVISYLAFTESSQTEAITVNDKLNHFLAFVVLAWLTDKAFLSQPLLLKMTFLFGYGVLIEVVQSQLPYREFSLLDFVADGVGVFLYFLAIKIFFKSSQRRVS